MLPHFTVRDFELPALYEPLDDLGGLRLQVGTQQGLRFEFAKWVAHDNPANGDSGMTSMKPDRCATGDFDGAFQFAVPIPDAVPLPAGLRVGDGLG